MANYNLKNYFQLEMMTYVIFNTYVRDNFEAVRQPALAKIDTTSASDFTTTSTSWADISSTYFQATITPNIQGSLTCRLAVEANLMVQPNSGATNYSVYFDILVDGVSVSGGTGIKFVHGNSGNYVDASFRRILTDISAGAKTVKIQWKVESGATARIYAANGSTKQMKGQFSVMEC